MNQVVFSFYQEKLYGILTVHTDSVVPVFCVLLGKCDFLRLQITTNAFFSKI